MADQESLTTEERQLLDQIDRDADSPRGDLRRRHYIQALAALGLLGSGARELYRRRLLRDLPSLRISEIAQGAEREFSWRPDPDEVAEGALEAGGYSALVALASVGGENRAVDHPLLTLATAGISLFQTVSSARQLVDQLGEGRSDAYTSIDTILSASTFSLMVPETIRAIRHLVGEDDE